MNKNYDLAKSQLLRDKQISKLNRIEDEIIRRVEKVKDLDSKFDNSTDKLYSMSEEEIRAKFESWRRRLREGNMTPSQVEEYKKFNNEINSLYKSMKKYAKDVISDREKKFLKALEENGESVAKYKKLLNKMTDKEKRAFFTSDAFMMPTDWYYASSQFREFAEVTRSSVIYAKLEEWVMNHTHILDDKVYNTFEKYEDRIKIENERRKKHTEKQYNYGKKTGSIYTKKQMDHLDYLKRKEDDKEDKTPLTDKYKLIGD